MRDSYSTHISSNEKIPLESRIMKIDINFDIKKKARKQNIHMAKTNSLQFSRYNHRYEIHHTELVA